MMAIDLADIEARPRRLEGISEIRRLRMQYHSSINDGRSDESPALYARTPVRAMAQDVPEAGMSPASKML